MDVNGSPEYALTWKHWDMPSGPPICALRARARPTSDNACSGWPTPAHQDGEHCSGQSERTGGRKSNLTDTATLAGWPTPMAGSLGTDTYNPAGNTDSSRRTVSLVAGWGTPSARDWKNGQASDETMNHNARPLNEQAVATGGFWSDSEWLPCLDAKARRIEPGIFPLVDGLPGAVDGLGPVSRVGALRGAGNAIVPQVAAQFISAFMALERETG